MNSLDFFNALLYLKERGREGGGEWLVFFNKCNEILCIIPQ